MRCRDESASDAGFSLIEVLVVVGLLAVIGSLAVPAFSKKPDSIRLQTTSNDLASALRTTRTAAITRRAEATFTIDVDGRTYESAVVPRSSFSSDIQVSMKAAAGLEALMPSSGAFRFFPDGSSTGGDITLSLHGLQESICVAWLTGAIRRGRFC